MLQASVNEAVRGAVPLAVPIEATFAQSCARDSRGYDDHQRFKSDLNLAMAAQRQMLPVNTKQLPTVKYAGTTSAARAAVFTVSARA